MKLTDRIAEVLDRAQAFGGKESLNTANLADLLVDTLGLTQQWSVTEKWEGRSNATFSDPEDADNFAASIVSKFWRIHHDVAGASIAEPKPQIETRWTTKWERTDA